MAVVRALLFLRLATLRNLVRSRLRRLRQPRYLAGALAGAAYFWFFFLRRAGSDAFSRGMTFAFVDAGTMQNVAAGLLLLPVLLIWLLPGDEPGLSFTAAEVAFLFPAPLTRRQLIHYRLLNGLSVSLLSAVFLTLFSGGYRGTGIGAVRHISGWWLVNSLLSLHHTAAALTISRLSDWGLRSRGRRWGLAVAGLLVLGAAGAAAWQDDRRALWLLAPTRLVVAPFFATDAAGYALAFVPVAGLLLLHYFWIVRLESPFEESSVARAEKAAELVARVRSGKGVRFGGKARARPDPFRLRAWFPPELALLWKNLLAAPAYLSARNWAIAAVLITALATWLKAQPGGGGPGPAIAGIVALVLIPYLLAFGAQIARNDLRGDLLNADLLKSYPLPGWRLVLGQLLAPAALLTGILWLLVLVVALVFEPRGENLAWLTPPVRVAAAAAFAAVLPALTLLQLIVPNAATLLLPAWAQVQRGPAGGIDIMGQRLLLFAGQVLCIAFALLPAAGLAAFTVFVTQWILGPVPAILLATLPVLLVLAGEIWLGLWWLGERFERLDISAELRP